MKDIHGQDDTIPGKMTETKTNLLCMGSAIMEKFTPLNQICDHVCAFHLYSNDIQRQVIAHHYCSVLSEDLRQCVIYDSDKANARLIGIEYIISEDLFKKLPEDERKYWHSHVCEIKTGVLIAPNVPKIAEHEVMKKLINTYGKTIHTWQIDRGDVLPLGEPQLMMSFTKPEQINWDLVNKRDELLGVSTVETKLNREDIEVPEIVSGADDWYHTGKAIVFQPTVIDMTKKLT